jgi:hypothetical protein
MCYPEDLQRVANCAVWFKALEESLQEPELFLAHLMTYRTVTDIATALKCYSEADVDRVLKDLPAGIFDLRSWNYWNLRYRHEPVSPLPDRQFPQTGASPVR